MGDHDRFLDALKQQKLHSHQFSCTPTFVFSFIFFLGLLCVGIGVLLTAYAKDIVEQRVEYTDWTINETMEWHVQLKGFANQTVFIYYELEGFNQLHYSMRHSYDYKHFAEGDYSYICTGEPPMQSAINESRIWTAKIRHQLMELHNITGFFAWLLFPQSRFSNGDAPVPCGERAKFFFKDTIALKYPNGTNVTLANKDIAFKPRFESLWGDDELKLFKNPKGFNASDPCSSFIKPNTEVRYDKPRYWTQDICEMENAMENEDFNVWMRPAYATTFRKLWKKVEGGLEDGNYTILLENNWSPRPLEPTYWNRLIDKKTLFKKTIVFSTTNWQGGKSNFLGIAYLVVGVTILLIGCALSILQSFFPSYLREENDGEISWRKDS